MDENRWIRIRPQRRFQLRPPVELGVLFKPHEPIRRSYYVTTMAFSITFIFTVWGIVTYGGLVHPAYFLPTPTQVWTAGVKMVQTGELYEHVQASLLEILGGWILAVIFALPVGILMGSFKFFEALFEPVVDFVRYLPVSAMIPLLILWTGIDLKEKVAVIFIGTFFQ